MRCSRCGKHNPAEVHTCAPGLYFDKHDLQWFIKRIGTTVYRRPIDLCKCEDCQKTSFDIFDISHAKVLYDTQNELDIRYSDKPIE